MARIFILLIACGIAGCRPSQTTGTPTPNSRVLVDVQSIVAEQLGLRAADVNPEQTFAAIGADDLDLVEITMEVEDRFGIMISDDALIRAAGTRDTDSLCVNLTIRTFATVAETAPKQPQDKSSPVTDDGTLRESQVGTYGDLTKRLNPKGLVLVFVPSFEELLQLEQQHLGRELDESEIDTLRQKAAVIALPQEMADKLKKQNSDRDAANTKE